MNSQLSGAYKDALEQLSKEKGEHTAILVEAVIESKMIINNLSEALQPLDDDDRKKIMDCIVEQISSSVATMCRLVGKGFKEEIMPCVEQVTKQAAAKMQ